MAETTHHSKKNNTGGTMAVGSKGAAASHAEAEGKSRQRPELESLDQKDHQSPDQGAAPAAGFSNSQHAQITQALFEQHQVGVAIVGLDGRIQQANRALASLLHFGQDELAGKTFEALVSGSATLHKLSSPAAEPSSGDRRAAPFLNHLARKSGDTVACIVDSHAICDENGKATHFLVFVTDAQSAKDAEQRNRFESELHHAQALQTLGTLASGVAHDFNNALEVIIGFASLARVRLSTADPLHEPLKIIEESAKGAAELARQILDVSKNKTDTNEPVDVEDIVSTVVSIISRTFDRNIRIEHRIGAEVPFTRGSRSRLVQAILNLCINARDAMPMGGKITVTAERQTLNSGDPRITASSAPGDYARISVRDSGEGMPAEILEKIFIPHFTTKSHGQGFGMGLALVDQIVKESQGFISVASKPGEGSEFVLYLPAAAGERPRAAHRQAGQLISGRGRVLVVDDEPRVLEFLEKGLTRLGYEVVPAESGSKACEIYSRQSDEISCVLLDLIMPGMSGLEAYARLRDINPSVRVILSSGYSSGRLRREAVEAGGPEILEKPYTLEELSRALLKIRRN